LTARQGDGLIAGFASSGRPMSHQSPYVIVARGQVPRRRSGWLWLLWLLSMAAAVAVALWWERGGVSAEGAGESAQVLRGKVGELEERLASLRQRNVMLKRSDDVSRAANQELQQNLAERDERIAALEADVAFYLRLAGASAQRQGLSIHSLSLRPEADGAHHFALTLTQTIKKTQLSRGSARLVVEGVSGGQLRELDWDALLQSENAPPLSFEFRYFQQLEGTVMLPEGFTPHRVRVLVEGDSGRSERSLSWAETQSAEAARPNPQEPGA
jgi:hypothetical protein